MADAEVLIDVSNLEYSYAPGLPQALRGVSLQVRRGEFVAFIGQNGAGKTTLAKHFNGLLKPTAGSVFIAGKDTRKLLIPEVARQVGYCYQNPDHQIFNPTVGKEVAFGPRNLGLPAEQVDERVRQALELVGLSDKKDQYPFLLGRGERQKLAVAAVLAMGSPVLVVDEPTTGLDLRGTRSIMDLLSRWNREEGRTVIIITHDMNVVAEYVPRTVVMAQGKIIADGATRSVLSDTEVLEKAFLKAPQVTRLAKALADPRVPVDPMTVDELFAALQRVLASKTQTPGGGR